MPTDLVWIAVSHKRGRVVCFTEASIVFRCRFFKGKPFTRVLGQVFQKSYYPIISIGD
jgi:hypothetical protein